MKRIFTVTTVLLSIVLLLPSLASSQETYKFERMWPTLKQPWYFNGPQDTEIDSFGNFFVVDTGNHRIHKFNPDGAFITKWGKQGGGVGEFTWPSGIAIDQEGNIYVADTYNHRIQKFNLDGTFITKWGNYGTRNGEFFMPSGIAIDQGGNVYVADTLNHRIQKFTPDGVFLTKWGSLGSGDGRFDSPIGIDLDQGGNIYVVDTFNHRIQKFSPDGVFLTKWGSEGSDNREFLRPSGITIDQDNNIYVTDTENHRIQKFTPDGIYITKWGSYGIGKGEFAFPGGISLDLQGNIYIADYGNGRVQQFTSDGTYITKWGSTGSADGEFDLPRGITVYPTGEIYVADALNDRIQKFTPDGIFITKWGNAGTGEGEFNDPFGITTDANGDIYVADTENHRIQKFTSDGLFITKWGSEGSGDGEFNNPFGITTDANGNIYVADTKNHRIQKFTSDGLFITKWGSDGSGDGAFNYPFEIAIDSVNNVYVVDAENHRIQKFTSDGTFITKWGERGANGGEFDSPRGIAIDPEDNIYIADTYNHRVQQFTSDGTFITKWGYWGTSPGQMNHPMYLALNKTIGDSYIYVADTLNNRVQVFEMVTMGKNNKAIIVAGGGPYPGNSLWDATQVCTNFTYRALSYQGYTKNDIYYLTADTDLDLDGNNVFNDVTGYSDDVDAVPGNTNLQQAITEWAVSEGADSLVVYLNDHGGEDTFRISESETLPATTFAIWLDDFQASTSGKVTVVYEACKSGSFIDDLQGSDRIIITSTLPDEQAKFLSSGTISFSNFFWTHIFNGLSVGDAYVNATEIVNFAFSNQNPQLSGDADNVYIGNGVGGMIGEAPEIESVSDPQELTEEANSAILSAYDVTDLDGIARVWAVIWPPDFDPGSVEDPLLDVPACELLPVGGNDYEGTYSDFTTDGTYHIAVYAMDDNNNISLPQLTTVSKNYNVTRRAIIIAGGSSSSVTRSIIETNAGIAYDALKSQLFNDDDIEFRSVTTFRLEIDGAPSNAILENYLNILAGDAGIDNLDLTMYLIGEGTIGTFTMNDDPVPDVLSASDLDAWLDRLQNAKPGSIKVIYDGDSSGSFVSPLTLALPPDERIIITSSGVDAPAYFSGEGDTCFSSFFWRQVASGATLYNALTHAKQAISYLSRLGEISFSCYNPQSPLMDADGDGTPNEDEDYEIARARTIGIGMKFADDPPQIGSASVEDELGVVTIVAEDITTTTNLTRVWAIIKPIGYCPGYSGEETQEFEEVELVDPEEDGRYEGIYMDPIDCYKVSVYAMDVDGNTSLPKETKIYQEGGDIYEPDDTREDATVIVPGHPTPQPHTFHYDVDEDWVKFYGQSGEYYTVLADNLGDDCAPILELYFEDDTAPITVEYTILNNTVSIDFACLEEGVYHVLLYNGTTGEEAGYDLQVYYPYWPDALTLIAGKVEEKGSLDDIDGAVITTTGGGSAISVGGEYELIQKPGNWWLDAVKHGYSFNGLNLTVESGVAFMQRDIEMFSTRPECNQDNDCDDELFCNGLEVCVNGSCQEGSIPCLDDGLFCNGEEACDEAAMSCVSSGNPCQENLRCDEVIDACVDCTEDTECDDGIYCTGGETCANGICQSGISPCSEGITCDEENDVCNNPYITVTPHVMLQSRWIPLIAFLRISGTHTHFDSSSIVTFSSSLMALPFVWGKETITCIGLMMPSFLTKPHDGTIEVNVTTDLEKVSDTIEVKPLLFITD